jgi:hypothetical protein
VNITSPQEYQIIQAIFPYASLQVKVAKVKNFAGIIVGAMPNSEDIRRTTAL